MEKNNQDRTAVSSSFSKCLAVARFKLLLIETYLAPLALLWARFYMARIFWSSGQTKISNLETATQLFEWEYIPKWQENSKSVLGTDLSWTVPDPALAAHLATYAELAFPVLLLVGIGARAGAFGLLAMAAAIELFIYPGTAEHYHWMTILLLLVTVGPGRLSVDHYLRMRFLKQGLDSISSRAS